MQINSGFWKAVGPLWVPQWELLTGSVPNLQQILNESLRYWTEFHRVLSPWRKELVNASHLTGSLWHSDTFCLPWHVNFTIEAEKVGLLNPTWEASFIKARDDNVNAKYRLETFCFDKDLTPRTWHVNYTLLWNARSMEPSRHFHCLFTYLAQIRMTLRASTLWARR